MPVYEKIDPEFKARWVAALRSGEYQRGQEALRSGFRPKATFCCLGVACDVINPNRWHRTKTMWGRFTRDWEWGENGPGDTYELPFIDKSYCEDPKSLFASAAQVLAKMNDEYDLNDEDLAVPLYSFEDIADWIEENL